MPEMLEESSSLKSTTIGVYRTAATVKGGRRFSFGALVVVGNRNGQVGYGYAKANEVPQAIEKAQKVAKRSLKNLPRLGSTLHHEVEGKFSSSKVRLMPASPGTGVVAVFGMLWLLHRHAWRRRRELELDAIEEHLTRAALGSHALSAGVGATSLAIALFLPGSGALAGWIYFLMGPLHGVRGYRVAKRLERLVAESG